MSTDDEEKVNGYVLCVAPDPDPINPREDDNVGTIFYKKGSKYVLGDTPLDADERKELESNLDRYIWLPVYAYVHGGVTLNTTGFASQWDSGQCGIIAVSNEKAQQFFGENPQRTRGAIQLVEKILRAEIEEFSAFLEGRVYMYVIYKREVCPHCQAEKEEVVDSCGGFFNMTEAAQEGRRHAESLPPNVTPAQA